MAALPPGPNILVSFKVAKDAEDPSSVYIPIRDSNEVVEVPLSRLPAEPADIIDCLKPEIAPLDIWLKFAVEYYKRGQVQQFKNMLEEATGPDAAMVYKEEFSDLRTTIYNTLGAYYVEAGSQTKDAQTREKAFQAAIDRFNVATRVSQSNPLTYVGKGLLFLAKNNLTQADNDGFKIALELDKECIPALLGKACILFHQSKFEEALSCYRRAMTVNPVCPAAVRLGVGLCLFKLKETAKAKAAFERVLELEPTNVHALVALATLELNQADECFTAIKSVAGPPKGTDAASLNAAQRDELKKDKANEHLRNASELITRAYQSDPLNPQALIYLANAFFFRGELQQSRVLAQRALDNAQSPEQEAESAYQLARAFHAEGENFRAFNFYSRAVDRNGNHWLALFGLGQMFLSKKSMDKAREIFERIIRKFPDNFHAIRILGGIYAQIGENVKAKETLKRGTKLFPLEFDLWVELARVCEKSFPNEAYQAYTQAIAIPAKAGYKILPEFWNNLGVITHKLNKHSESRLAYEKALEGFGVDVAALKEALGTAGSALHRPLERAFEEHSKKKGKEGETKEGEAKSGDGPAAMDADEAENEEGEDAKMTVAGEDPLGGLDSQIVLPPESVSSAYNLAVLLESQGHVAQAALVHRIVIRQHKYIASFLRMGQLERAAGDLQSASWWFKRALQVDKKNVEAHIFIGNLHLERRDYENAIKWYDRLLKHVDEKDVYGKLAASGARLAAVTYNVKKQPVPKPELLKDKEKELRRSAAVFREVLTHEPSNVFAANGLGVVLAENGQTEAAKDLFTKLREGSGEIWEVGLNLAHTLFAAEQFDSAVKVYVSVMNKFALHSEPLMLLYLARAYYHQDLFPQAKAAVVKALRIRPQDPVIWYNLALICEHHGVNIFKRAREQSLIQEVRKAVQELRQAENIYARLEAQLPGPEEPVPADLSEPQRQMEDRIRTEKARLSGARAAVQAAAQAADPPSVFPSLTGYPAAQPPKERFRLSCSPEDESQLHAGKARAHRKFVSGILLNDAPQHLAYAAKQEEFLAKMKEKGEQARLKAEKLAVEEAERKKREEEEMLLKQQAQAAETKKKLEQLQAEWAVERAEKERREREKKADEEDEKAALDKLDDDGEFKEGDKGEEEEEEAASGSDSEKKKRKKRRSDSSGKDSKKKRKKRKGKASEEDAAAEQEEPAEEEAEAEAEAEAEPEQEEEEAAEPAETDEAEPTSRKRRLTKATEEDESETKADEPLGSDAPEAPPAADSAAASAEVPTVAEAEDDEDGAVRRNTKRAKKRVADDDEDDGAAAPAATGGDDGPTEAGTAAEAEPPAA